MSEEGCYEVPGIVALKIFAELSASGEKLSSYVKPYQKYVHSGEISLAVDDPKEILARVKEHFAGAKISELDGLSVESEEAWFNVRASNTEPLLRFSVEAVDTASMEKIKSELLAIIKH